MYTLAQESDDTWGQFVDIESVSTNKNVVCIPYHIKKRRDPHIKPSLSFIDEDGEDEIKNKGILRQLLCNVALFIINLFEKTTKNRKTYL